MKVQNKPVVNEEHSAKRKKKKFDGKKCVKTTSCKPACTRSVNQEKSMNFCSTSEHIPSVNVCQTEEKKIQQEVSKCGTNNGVMYAFPKYFAVMRIDAHEDEYT